MTHDGNDGQKLQEMLRANEEQTRFYDSAKKDRGNLLTKVWHLAREAQEEVRTRTGMDELLLELHWRWLGDLSDKRVLDLGCHSGNVLSLGIAERSRSYLGIDLSSVAIDRLQARLQEKNLTHAEAKALDFLEAQFDSEFDVVYAYSVAHHFKHMNVFLETLARALKPNGRVVTFDPLQTSWEARLVRAAYRPFQSDRDWEWPFTKETFDLIQTHFEILEVQGLMGQAKWSLPLSVMGTRMAARIGQHFHDKDVREATTIGPGLWRCMQVAMYWRKRQDGGEADQP